MRVISPTEPFERLFTERIAALIVKKDCAMVQLTPIGETVTDGASTGLIDGILAAAHLYDVLGPSLQQIIQIAMTHAPEPISHRTSLAWIGMFQVEDASEVITYLGRLPLDQVTAVPW